MRYMPTVGRPTSSNSGLRAPMFHRYVGPKPRLFDTNRQPRHRRLGYDRHGPNELRPLRYWGNNVGQWKRPLRPFPPVQ